VADAGAVLRVNGAERRVASRTVGALLRELGHDPQRRGIAIAVNGEVVRRAERDDRALEDGDSVEIVGAVQGG